MKQVTRKRTIMKVIDNHLCSSLSSIPSKRNVAMAPPISAKPMRSQKSLLASFLMIFFCSSETADSVGGASSRLVGRVLSFPDGSDVHLPDIFPSSFDSGSRSGSRSGSGSGSCSDSDVSSTVSCSGESFFFISL